MNVVSAIVGLVLLLFGRRLFWFFVAATGFLAGMYLAREYLQIRSDWMVIAIALLAGLLGALLSIVLQKVAVAVAGLAAGAYLGAFLADRFGAHSFIWIGFALGGVIGAILLLTLFEWTLIVLSSLIGAAFLSDGVATKETALLVFGIACVTGIVAQALQLKRPRKTEPRPVRAEHS